MPLPRSNAAWNSKQRIDGKKTAQCERLPSKGLQIIQSTDTRGFGIGPPADFRRIQHLDTNGQPVVAATLVYPGQQLGTVKLIPHATQCLVHRTYRNGDLLPGWITRALLKQNWFAGWLNTHHNHWHIEDYLTRQHLLTFETVPGVTASYEVSERALVCMRQDRETFQVEVYALP